MQIACRGEMAMEVDEVENGGLLAEMQRGQVARC